MSKPALVLGIESSCDETSRAVVADGSRVLSNVVTSQIDLHGGDAFRFGDFEVNRDMYPRGRESLKAE